MKSSTFYYPVQCFVAEKVDTFNCPVLYIPVRLVSAPHSPNLNRDTVFSLASRVIISCDNIFI